MKWQLGGKCALTGSGKPARSGPAAPAAAAATTIEVTTATTTAAVVPAALNTQDENQVARARSKLHENENLFFRMPRKTAANENQRMLKATRQ